MVQLYITACVNPPLAYFLIRYSCIVDIVAHHSDQIWASSRLSFRYGSFRHRQQRQLNEIVHYLVIVFAESKNMFQIYRESKRTFGVGFFYNIISKSAKHLQYASDNSNLQGTDENGIASSSYRGFELSGLYCISIISLVCRIESPTLIQTSTFIKA